MMKTVGWIVIGSCWLASNQARAQSFDADVVLR